MILITRILTTDVRGPNSRGETHWPLLLWLNVLSGEIFPSQDSDRAENDEWVVPALVCAKRGLARVSETCLLLGWETT